MTVRMSVETGLRSAKAQKKLMGRTAGHGCRWKFSNGYFDSILPVVIEEVLIKSLLEFGERVKWNATVRGQTALGWIATIV